MNCPKCGTEIPDRFKFCPECGSAMSSESRASAVEADLSLGGLRTMDPASPPADRSVGDLKTLAGSEGAGKSPSSSGAPLAERYELLEEIGRGGFAIAFRARDKRLGRTVAVKRLLATSAADPLAGQTIERFRREARAIAELNHRNIVGVFDHDCDAEGDYIVMEYVAGGSLRDYLRQRGGKLPAPEAVELIKGIAQGLGYAHRKSLIHRDIKPANVLMSTEGDDGGLPVPKIVDFGLARIGTDSELSMSGYGMGTPYYMPPEQRRNAKTVNHTADIYALGKTLYELVTGELPDNVDPTAIPKSPGLAEVIFKCVKSNPEDRYFSIKEVIEGLDSIEREVAAGGGATADGNRCPACGTDNEKGARFCAGCGAGMVRPCPECGKDIAIQATFCTDCGTDVPAFLRVRDATEKIERYAERKDFSRVAKEAGLITDTAFPGPKGGELLAGLRRKAEEARRLLERRSKIPAELQAAHDCGDIDLAERLVEEYRTTSDEFPDSLKSIALRVRWQRQILEVCAALDLFERANEQRDWTAAETVATGVSIPEPQCETDGGVVAELRRRAAALRQALEVGKQLELARLKELHRRLRDATVAGENEQIIEVGAALLAIREDPAVRQKVDEAQSELAFVREAGEAVSLFDRKEYAACAARCDALIAKHGDFNIESSGGRTSCSRLQSLAMSMMQSDGVRYLRRLFAHRSDSQLREISADTENYRWNPDAVEAARQLLIERGR